MRTSRGQRRRALKAILSTVVLVSAMALASWTTVLAQEPESLELPAAGGTLSFADGAVSLSAPDGTATSAVTISYTPLDATSAPAAAPEGMDFGSQIFSLEVLQDGVADPTFSFRQLVSVTVQYGDADLAGAMGGRDDSIKLYVHDSVGGGWLALDAAIQDVVHGTITTSIQGQVTLALVVTPEPVAEPTATAVPTATPVPTATAVLPESGDIAPWSGAAMALGLLGAAFVLGGGYVLVRSGARR